MSARVFIPKQPLVLLEANWPVLDEANELEQSKALAAGNLMLAAAGIWQDLQLGQNFTTEQAPICAVPELVALSKPGLFMPTPNGGLYLPNGEGSLGDIHSGSGQLHESPGIRVEPNGDCDTLVITQQLAGQTGCAASLLLTHLDYLNNLDGQKVRFGAY